MHRFPILLLLTCSLSLWGLTLTHEGRSNYAIVGDSTEPAVQDLATYLHKISGATLPVSAKQIPDKPAVIVTSNDVWRTDKPCSNQGFAIYVKDGNLILYSPGKAGRSHAVYTLLDELLGCRFLTKSVEAIPHIPTIVLPDDLHLQQEPSLVNRGLIAYSRCSGGDKDWQRRNRLGYDIQGLAFHINFQYLPPETYFKRHPEWYTLNKQGKREAKDHWFCWTNQDMLRELEKNLRREMAKLPENHFLRMGQGDGSVNCHCPVCQAVIKEYGGSPNAPALLGLNQILTHLEREFPRHKIITFAYWNTEQAPIKDGKLMPLHRNLYINYVHSSEHMKSFYSTVPFKRKQAEKLRLWKDIMPRLLVWDWNANFRYNLVPFPNIKARAEDIRWFKQQGACGYYPQILAGGEFFQLREWLFARILWNTDLDIEQAEQDFLNHFYGPKAARPIWTYLKQMQDLAERVPAEHNAVYGGFPETIRTSFFPGNRLEESLQLLRQAEEQAETPLFRQRVADLTMRSLAALSFLPPKPLLRTRLPNGNISYLPEGKANLADMADRLGEAANKDLQAMEHGNQAWQRRNFMIHIGGTVRHQLKDQKLTAEFIPALDGILCGLVEPTSQDNALAFGPIGLRELLKPSVTLLGGLQHQIGIAVGDHLTYRHHDTSLDISFGVCTNIWWDPGAILGTRRYTLKDGVLSARTTIRANRERAPFFTRPDLSHTYNFHLNDPIYDNILALRLAMTHPSFTILQPGSCQVLTVAPGEQTTFTLKAPFKFILHDVGTQRHPLVFASQDPIWKDVTILRLKEVNHLILKLNGGKLGVSYDQETNAGSWSVSRPTLDQVKRETTVQNLKGTLQDGILRLDWNSDGTACQVYAGTKRLNKAPILNGSFAMPCRTVQPLEIKVVKANGVQGKLRLVPLAGRRVIRLQSQNSFAQAIDKLPTSPWTGDWTLLCSSGTFSPVTVPPELVRAAGSHRLNIWAQNGCQPTFSRINFNGLNVNLQNAVLSVESKAKLNAGKQSIIIHNRFKGAQP